MAKAASPLKREAPAIWPTSCAALSAEQPGSGEQLGGERAHERADLALQGADLAR